MEFELLAEVSHRQLKYASFHPLPALQAHAGILFSMLSNLLQDFRELVDEYQLPNQVLQSLASQRITSPTPIQSQALPLLLSGRDVLAISPTGSGKTLAFVLPILAGLAKDKDHRCPYALLLAPTRELVLQTGRVVEEFKSGLAFKFACSSITQASAAGADFSKVAFQCLDLTC